MYWCTCFWGNASIFFNYFFYFIFYFILFFFFVFCVLYCLSLLFIYLVGGENFKIFYFILKLVMFLWHLKSYKIFLFTVTILYFVILFWWIKTNLYLKKILVNNIAQYTGFYAADSTHHYSVQENSIFKEKKRKKVFKAAHSYFKLVITFLKYISCFNSF